MRQRAAPISNLQSPISELDAVIVANGDLEASARLQALWERAGLRIAANGGARNARLALGRAPDVVVGDMDSVDDATRAWLDEHGVEQIQHPRAKDETDLELAVCLAQDRGADEITILGAFGGRVDQFLANVLLLTQVRNVKITDAASEMWVDGGTAESGERERVEPAKASRPGRGGTGDRRMEVGGKREIEGKPGDIVSLIPLDEQVAGITTTELEYPLRGETIARGSTRGISNVMLGERATVSWDAGMLLIVHLFG